MSECPRCKELEKRCERQTSALMWSRAAWEKERAGLQAEIERLRFENADLGRHLMDLSAAIEERARRDGQEGIRL